MLLSCALLASLAVAESDTWTFDGDPGLVERHDGTDSAFSWEVADGVLSLSVSREAAVQRLSMPLSGGPCAAVGSGDDCDGLVDEGACGDSDPGD